MNRIPNSIINCPSKWKQGPRYQLPTLAKGCKASKCTFIMFLSAGGLIHSQQTTGLFLGLFFINKDPKIKQTIFLPLRFYLVLVSSAETPCQAHPAVFRLSAWHMQMRALFLSSAYEAESPIFTFYMACDKQQTFYLKPQFSILKGHNKNSGTL